MNTLIIYNCVHTYMLVLHSTDNLSFSNWYCGIVTVFCDNWQAGIHVVVKYKQGFHNLCSIPVYIFLSKFDILNPF